MGFDEKLQTPQSEAGVSSVALYRNLDRKTTSFDLAGGELDFSAGITGKFRILQVLIHASQALSSTTISVTFDSLSGANYDTLIGGDEFDGAQDMGLISGENMLGSFGEDGDDIKVASSGGEGVGILYVTVMYEKI